MKKLLLYIIIVLVVVFLPMYLASVLAEVLADLTTGQYLLSVLGLTLIGVCTIAIVGKYALTNEDDEE